MDGAFPGVSRIVRPVYPAVQIPPSSCAEPEIIPAREVDARNRGCAGNNRLGCFPHSERFFATQIEKALTIIRYGKSAHVGVG